MPTPKVNLGHGNCASVPQLSSYAQAQAHYNSVKPIRGDEKVRPIGSRRFKWYRINKKDYIEDAPMYSATLGNTNMVEYYADGRISITTGGYRSITNNSFLNFVLRGLGAVVSVNGKWYWKPHRSENYYYFPIQRDHWLHLDGQGIPNNPVQEYKYVVNRKAMNAIRKRYMPIIEYGRLMLTADPLIPQTTMHELKEKLKNISFKIERGHVRWLAMKKDYFTNLDNSFEYLNKAIETNDLDMFYNITMLMGNSYGTYSYVKEKTECKPKDFTKAFDFYLKDMYHKEVFIVEEQPIGSAFYDANASMIASSKDRVTYRNYVAKQVS